jgi:TonB family protein
VLAIGFVASRMLHKQPAALRHWVLVTAILLAAAQPAMNRIIPSWHVAGISEPPTVADGTGVRTSVEFSVNTQPRRTATLQSMKWQRRAFQIWRVGLGVSIAVLLAAAAWLSWLGARASDAGESWQRPANAIRKRLGVRYPIRIAITQHPAMLVTWGAIRPVILLPRDAAAWPPDRIELVLAHEIAHLIRRDWLIQFAAEGLRAVYWFNPLFWIACSWLRRESEYACDDIVLDLGIRRTSYASHLVDLARTFSVYGRTWLPAPSIARPSTLERRVRAMLNTHIDRRPVSRLRRFAVALLLLGIAVPIAAASQGGTPSGILRDPSGRVLPGATVRLSAIGRDAIHETQSDASGAFQFPEIPDGDYMLSARLPGFLSARQRVRVSGSAAPYDVLLQVGTLQEEITVTSGPAVETRTASTAVRTPTTPACGSTELGGNLKPPMKLRDVLPRYKAQWVEAKIEGNVLLQAVLGQDGRVRGVEVVSPVHPDLEEEAIAAVSQWEFSPTYLNCAPIEVRMFVTVAFKLDR